MTKDQAEKIVTRIFARFPRAHLSEAVLFAWSGSFLEFDFHWANQHLHGPVTTARGEWPPSLNELRGILVRAREQERQRLEPAEIPNATLKHSVRNPLAKKYFAIIEYIRENAPTHLEAVRDCRDWRKRGFGENRKRIEATLVGKYGPEWWEEKNWMQDEVGNIKQMGGDLS